MSMKPELSDASKQNLHETQAQRCIETKSPRNPSSVMHRNKISMKTELSDASRQNLHETRAQWCIETKSPRNPSSVTHRDKISTKPELSDASKQNLHKTQAQWHIDTKAFGNVRSFYALRWPRNVIELLTEFIFSGSEFLSVDSVLGKDNIWQRQYRYNICFKSGSTMKMRIYRLAFLAL